MKQVYQQILSSKNGDCMKATMCSLLELQYDSVCNFVEYGDWWQRMEAVLNENGYKWGTRFHNEKQMDLFNPTDCFRPFPQLAEGFRLIDIKPEDTIDGFLFGSVLSPHHFNSQNLNAGLHMVVIDTNCNIVFDPNPEYAAIDHYPLSRLLGYNGVLEAWGVRKLKPKLEEK